jgi:hypothetical protein
MQMYINTQDVSIMQMIVIINAYVCFMDIH